MNEMLFPYDEVVGFFVASLGAENAERTVARAVGQLNLDYLSEFTSDQALRVLDTLTGEEGLVGITARLARTRIHLRLATQSTVMARDSLGSTPPSKNGR
jgi:hypothetical protein